MFRIIGLFTGLFLTILVSLAGWTTFVSLNKGPVDQEIKQVINRFSVNEMRFIEDVKDLSLLLAQDISYRINSKDLIVFKEQLQSNESEIKNDLLSFEENGESNESEIELHSSILKEDS